MIHYGAVADQGSILGKHAVLFRDVAMMDSVLGAYSYAQAGTVVYNAEIGPFCSIAGEVIVGLGAHPTSMTSTSPVFYDDGQPLPHFFAKGRQFTDVLPRTVIGADVWIGQRAMIKAGVNVGVGAVIGAGSIVTKDVPPYTIVAGNPCRTIRLRFPEQVCQRLLESRWWEFDEARLEKLAPFFPDPAFLLAEMERDN
ncbi:MAG: CatB-related O-acetyltransferase [Nitrosomonadales bacterium]|nr:CatB-related O-acetyltransferase [Nitrosomonadales bacterium]